MRRRRSGPDDLLVFREDGGWRDVRSEDVNAYLQEKAGEQFSAKDFRTWHGTVLAAIELAREGVPSSKGAESARSERQSSGLPSCSATLRLSAAAPISTPECWIGFETARRLNFPPAGQRTASRLDGKVLSSEGSWR
jgi:hypothetical protein